MITVRVPATSANLGPGFDCLGLALTLYNQITMEPLPPGSKPAITVSGEGKERVSRNTDNLVYRAAAALFKQAKAKLPPLRLHLQNGIPVSRGLGSSAAAIVGGITAANCLLDKPFTPMELLTLASRLEGHPDNVAPALFGGAVVSCWAGEEVKAVVFHPKQGLEVAAVIPEESLATADSRRALPVKVPFSDAVFNVGRAAALVASLMNGHWDNLAWAGEDKLHQPYRIPLMRGWQEAKQAAMQAGALGFCLSGSGSTMIAFCQSRQGDTVARAMAEALQNAGIKARGVALKPAASGAISNSMKNFPAGNQTGIAVPGVE